jgi:hypothetical protein
MSERKLQRFYRELGAQLRNNLVPTKSFPLEK